MVWVSATQLQEALNAADFPADKEALLTQARQQMVPDEVIRALRSLPPEIEYANLDEVIRSVRVDVGSPPTAEQKALKARESRDDQLPVSERLRPPP
jgi:hypothetical protein